MTSKIHDQRTNESVRCYDSTVFKTQARGIESGFRGKTMRENSFYATYMTYMTSKIQTE